MTKKLFSVYFLTGASWLAIAACLLWLYLAYDGALQLRFSILFWLLVYPPAAFFTRRFESSLDAPRWQLRLLQGVFLVLLLSCAAGMISKPHLLSGWLMIIAIIFYIFSENLFGRTPLSEKQYAKALLVFHIACIMICGAYLAIVQPMPLAKAKEIAAARGLIYINHARDWIDRPFGCYYFSDQDAHPDSLYQEGGVNLYFDVLTGEEVHADEMWG